MKRISLLWLGLIFTPLALVAQKWTLTGTLTDTANVPLVGASAVLLQASDSVLVSFGLSNQQGTFKMGPVKAGDYLLQLSYLGYEKQSLPLTLGEAGGKKEMGTIQLQPEILTTEEVTIEGEVAPIVIKGDTVEYNANAFNTQPNAVVEDLLRQLPGVQVERDGTIKTQGKTVQKVLVEGKEFFGDDPKMATKNLPADAIDKVQVFDKASELAEFTGIEDGQEQKTINLKLKEDKKQGVFGNVTGGYGTKDRYAFRGMVNHFNSNLQLSALGLANNVNEAGFSMDEFISFMGGLRGLMTGGGGGGMRLSLNTAEVGLPISQGLSDGFTATQAGGLNMNYDFSKKSRLNLSYFYNGLQNDSEREVFRESVLPGDSYRVEETSDQRSVGQNHSLNYTFRQELDSSQQLILRGGIRLRDSKSTLEGGSESRSLEGVVQNQNLRSNEGSNQVVGGQSRLTYRKRFRKKGRNFSSQFFLSLQKNEQDADLYAENGFLPNDPTKGFVDTLNQTQVQANDLLDYEVRLNYTEPLGKGRYLGLNFNHSNFGEEADRMVEDQTPIRRRNEQLSYAFRRGFVYNRGGTSIRKVGKEARFSSGVDVQAAELQGDLYSINDRIVRNYLTVLPRAHFDYDFGNSTNLNLDYETALKAPGIQQLQPIIDNRDPLNVYQGNPELEAEYEHALNANFFTYDQFNFRSFFAFVRATYTRNRISQARAVDSLFRQVIQPINVPEAWTGEGSVSFSTPLRFMSSKIRLDARPRFDRSIIRINGQENQVDRWSGRLRGVLENRKKDKVDIVVGAEIDLSQTRFSEASDLDQQFVNQRYYLDVRWNVTKKWVLRTSFDYFRYAGQSFEEEQVIPLWKASISRYLLKFNRGELKLSAFDLLDQNQGFNRVSQYNYLEEERILSLSRYFLLSFTYNLSKMGGKQDNGIQINVN
ncbi:MAG: TonB-dependent receptor [Bacteroidota bacterium]